MYGSSRRSCGMIRSAALGSLTLALALSACASAPRPGLPLPIDLANSAEAGWLKKAVQASRLLDDMSDPATWHFQGTGRIAFTIAPAPMTMPVLRVDMIMYPDGSAPTRNHLSAVNLKRSFDGEDWSGYDRLSLWIRPHLSGFPMLPLEIALHNDGAVKVPDSYGRDGIHYVTLRNGEWQHVVWEITPLARDRVTSIEIGYWVNRMIAARGDSVSFEIGKLELQRVEPDHYEGWDVAPGRIAFSNTGYPSGSMKTALSSDLTAPDFQLLRLDDAGMETVVLSKPVQRLSTPLGTFQQMDFSEVRAPGRYVVQAGDRRTRPFAIGDDVWRRTILEAINFFYAERCGFAVPGYHGVEHADWLATHGTDRIVMNGGWHDAGDFSQGLVNTGEATYAMFALAERLQQRDDDPALLRRLLDEARWGLDWVLKVRFPGGYRIGFASNNIWTDNVVGTADDRTREARNNPNVNYIAAAAEAIAARVLKESEPALAARSLATAEDDWKYAIVGKEGPETWSTPAFAATPLELAGIGILASVELYRATGKPLYADKAVELAKVIVGSQQTSFVGTEFPLAGFFYTSPAKDTLFHQFHRGNDQAAIVALAKLVETLPNHPDWMTWYATVARYAEYQKRSARATAPYGVLPAYVYRDDEYLQVPEQGGRYQSTRAAFRDQVLQGLPMGDGWYLRSFPVWFARRGNYGVLLSQAKALSAAARLRGDSAAQELAQEQAEWIVGRNPFVQSTMYGEGYDWAQQYSVSTGDIVGSLPVGMQTRGASDAPYWPSQNSYVYKEVWVHSTSRWLWLMEDIAVPRGIVGPPPGAVKFVLLSATTDSGDVTIQLSARGTGSHLFSLRSDNLVVAQPEQGVTLSPDRDVSVRWTAKMKSTDSPWVAVVIPDRDVGRRQDLVSTVSRNSPLGRPRPKG
jgi:hypothetical protein